MKQRNRLPAPRVIQSVIEWRYAKAHRYWDDCGKLIASVEAALPGLVCNGLLADGFNFEGALSGLTGAKFYWDKAIVIQTEKGDERIAEAAAAFWEIVRDGLTIMAPQRIGHRSWLVFEMESTDLAARWLDGFDLWRLGDGDALGQPIANGCVLRTRLEPLGRTARIEVNAGTFGVTPGSKQYRGVLLDIDISLELPNAATTPTAQLIQDNRRFLKESIQPFFQKK